MKCLADISLDFLLTSQFIRILSLDRLCSDAGESRRFQEFVLLRGDERRESARSWWLVCDGGKKSAGVKARMCSASKSNYRPCIYTQNDEVADSYC